MTTTPLYDAFSADYDRFVDWPGRLAHELPWIERLLTGVGAGRVLDAACGTGWHAIALTERGYRAAGADVSRPMIERARANAVAAGQEVPFFVAGFGELTRSAGGPYDVLLCLGNSLPHALTRSDLAAALADFAAALRPGGLLLIQNRNFDAVMARRERWMEPQAQREGEQEWVFCRFYDFNPDGTLTFNVVTLYRGATGTWRQTAEATLLRPWSQTELSAALGAAGFDRLSSYGDMTGSAFDRLSSGNLVMTAEKQEN